MEEEGHMPKNVGGPLEVRNRPKLTATKETGLYFYNHKIINGF